MEFHQAKARVLRREFVDNGVTNDVVPAFPEDRDLSGTGLASTIGEPRQGAVQATSPEQWRGLEAARLGPFLLQIAGAAEAAPSIAKIPEAAWVGFGARASPEGGVGGGLRQCKT